MARAVAHRDLVGDYTVDVARTRIGFVAKHTVGPKVQGRFEKFTAAAHVGDGGPADAHLTLTIEAAGIQTGNPRRDDSLRDQYLNAADHPAITFASTTVKQVDENNFTVTGDLTIRGVTKQIAVDLELSTAPYELSGGLQVRLTGGATIDRRDWGVHWAAAPGLVSRKVELDLDITATRRP